MAKVLFATVPLLRTCIGGLCPSLTFVQLGTFLRARGHEVVLYDIAVDGDTSGLTMEEVTTRIAQRVVREAPSVLGLSCKVPADGRFSRELAREVKRHLPEVTIVVGGIWASPAHRAIIERVPEIDAVALGEGELAIAAIAARLDRGQTLCAERIDDVPGIAFRDAGGQVHVNAETPRLLPEELPPLDLSLVSSPEAYTVFPFLTSRGCPYTCTFCAETVIYPRHVDTSIARLQRDIALLEQFGRDYFLWLSDPLFGADPRRLEAIAKLLRDSRFHFLLESRVDVLRPDQIPLLWEAGCDLIYFGLESASFASLKRVDKVRTPQRHARYLAQTRLLMKACMEHDITPIFGVINPVPGDAVADLGETYDFLVELADIAAKSCAASGTDPGYHFYGFDYRFIRGTIDFANLEGIATLGTTWKNAPDDIFRDVVIDAASPEVSRSLALEFQRRVRSLVHTTPKGWERLMRSFPPQPLGGLG